MHVHLSISCDLFLFVIVTFQKFPLKRVSLGFELLPVYGVREACSLLLLHVGSLESAHTDQV